MMAPQSKPQRLKDLAIKIKKPKPEPISPENLPEHFKIGSTTISVFAIRVNGVIMHHEPVQASFGKETFEERMIRLRTLAIALKGELGPMKLVVSYSPIEFMTVEDYTDNAEDIAE